jgi:leucyl aminopeptidase
LIGIGEDDKDGSKIGAAIAKTISEDTVECSMVLPNAVSEQMLTDISSSLYSTLYSDNRYRTGDNIKLPAELLKSVSLVVPSISASATAALSRGKSIASGLFLTKDIVNAPHNVLNSMSLAETALRLAKEVPNLSCKILNKQDCEERGMGAYLGVARGSETEPQFIHVTYTPPTSDVPTLKVGVVGKGLLFDTGGCKCSLAAVVCVCVVDI